MTGHRAKIVPEQRPEERGDEGHVPPPTRPSVDELAARPGRGVTGGSDGSSQAAGRVKWARPVDKPLTDEHLQRLIDPRSQCQSCSQASDSSRHRASESRPRYYSYSRGQWPRSHPPSRIASDHCNGGRACRSRHGRRRVHARLSNRTHVIIQAVLDAFRFHHQQPFGEESWRSPPAASALYSRQPLILT